MHDIRYSPAQMNFARLHTVMMRFDAEALAQVARCRAQSHTARMLSVFLVTEGNQVGEQEWKLCKMNMPGNATAFWARISLPTR